MLGMLIRYAVSLYIIIHYHHSLISFSGTSIQNFASHGYPGSGFGFGYPGIRVPVYSDTRSEHQQQLPFFGADGYTKQVELSM